MTAISVPGGDYQVPLDIANAACDHMGSTQITSFQQNSKVAARLSFRYDKVRKYELERNLWVFSIRSGVIRPISNTSMKITFGAWDATKTYVLGSVVTDIGKIWQAKGAVPVNQQPSANPTYWQEYFGNTVCDVWTAGGVVGGPTAWDSTATYAAGMDAVGSDNNVYMSLVNGNLNHNPVGDGGVHWQLLGAVSTGNGYWAGELVYYPANSATVGVYLSLVNNNTQTPNAVASYVSTQTYNKGQTVTGSDTNVYQSLVDLNVGHDPVTDGAVHWAAIPGTQVDTPEGTNWLKLGSATVASLQIIYPLGAGPVNQTSTRNIYPLPNGFLREAPQDQKGGQLTWLGGPSNKIMLDWVYENGYFTTMTFTPINFRFGADVTDVSVMDPMFCELFAARLALEAVEVVTQAQEKKAAIGQEYTRWGNEARQRNGIEIGPVEAEEDEYISVRR